MNTAEKLLAIVCLLQIGLCRLLVQVDCLRLHVPLKKGLIYMIAQSTYVSTSKKAIRPPPPPSPSW